MRRDGSPEKGAADIAFISPLASSPTLHFPLTRFSPLSSNDDQEGEFAALRSVSYWSISFSRISNSQSSHNCKRRETAAKIFDFPPLGLWRMIRAYIFNAFKDAPSPDEAAWLTELRQRRNRSRHFGGTFLRVRPDQLQIDVHRRFAKGPNRPVPGMGGMASPGWVHPCSFTK